MAKEKRNDPTAVDGQIMAGLQQVYADLVAVKKLQMADPDNLTDPVDAEVWAHLEDVMASLKNVILDQAMDGAPDPSALRVANLLHEVRSDLTKVLPSVSVKHEPRTYSEYAPNSYFRDLASYQLQLVPEKAQIEARDRLMQHGKEVAYDVRSGSDYAIRSIREIRRADATETRAISTATASDGAFVTPQYLIDKWITYRSADRSFTNQCVNLPMPTYGTVFSVPAFTNFGAAAEQNTENSGTANTNPTAQNNTVTLNTFSGYVDISQQLMDRAGFQGQGGTFDVVIIQQSQSQLFAAVDTYIVQQAMLGASVVNQSTAATTTQFWLDLATARNQLADQLGVKLPGTHAFSTSDFFGWLSSQVDSEGRPIVVPDAAAMVSRDGDPSYSGWNGLFLPGNLKYFSDDNILAACQNTTIGVPSTQTAIIIGSPADMLMWVGDMVPYTAVQTNARNLTVLCGLRQYAAAIPRHAEAFSYIYGTGYSASLA